MKFLRLHKILVFYIFIAAIGVFLSVASYLSFISNKSNALKIRAEEFVSEAHDLSYRLLGHSDEKRMTYDAAVRKDRLADAGDYVILVPQLSVQAYSVYFNGAHLGTVGDMQTGRSNIWNTMHCFFIDGQSVAKENVLRIDTLAEYQTGLSAMPVTIIPASDLSRRLDSAKFFSEGINYIALGFAMFGAIIVFMLYLMSSPKNNSFLFFSLALLFLALYSLDYTGLYNLPFSYVVYKKLVLGSVYLAASLASFGMYRFFHSVVDLILGAVTLAGFAVIAIITPDMIAFKAAYQYYNGMFLLILLSWLRTSFKHFRKTDEAKMFFFGTAATLLFTLLDGYCSITGHIVSLNTPFVYAVIFSMTTAILFFREFLNKDMQIQIINNAHRESYFASITDGMTGLYNHRHLTHVLRRISPPYSVAMLDIDDFKDINDSFGHRFGDEIIRFLAASLTGHVRNTDYVFRYGGDEFFLIFPGCPANNAKEVLVKIKRIIRENPLKYEDSAVPFTFSGGVYFVKTEQDVDRIFDRVDNPLYKSKKAGKNKVTVFSSLEE